MIASTDVCWKPILAGLTAEVLFSALPLVVMVMVLHQAHHDTGLWASPEWSFGAAILSGQTLMRFVNGLVAAGFRNLTGPVTLTLAMVLVIGLAPSLIVLTMTLQAVEASKPVDLWLQWGQVCLFISSAIAYLLLGTVGEVLAKSHRPIAVTGCPGPG